MQGKKANFKSYDYIKSESQMRELANRCRSAQSIYFDTEFVSEDTYFPDLCLIQVMADDYVALVDPHAVETTREFWQALVLGDHATIVHSGREEFHFCLREAGTKPKVWFDAQIAAGLCGMEFPAAYSKLLSREIGVTVSKGETRTDWRQRPLSPRQLEYALLDVIHLPALWESLHTKLAELDRLSWLDDEMRMWQRDQEASLQRERWRRVSGLSGMSQRVLAVVRELWQFREEEARQRNQPAKRLLRDDLLVELARCSTADADKVREIRGVKQSRLGGKIDAMTQAIARGLDTPASLLPRTERTNLPAQVNATAQFLATALSSLCRARQLAPALVGTVQDVRDLLVYWHEPSAWPDSDLPILAQGWRAKIIGSTLHDLLHGKAVVRVHDPLSDEPLEIVPWRS